MCVACPVQRGAGIIRWLMCPILSFFLCSSDKQQFANHRVNTNTRSNRTKRFYLRWISGLSGAGSSNGLENSQISDIWTVEGLFPHLQLFFITFFPGNHYAAGGQVYRNQCELLSQALFSFLAKLFPLNFTPDNTMNDLEEREGQCVPFSPFWTIRHPSLFTPLHQVPSMHLTATDELAFNYADASWLPHVSRFRLVHRFCTSSDISSMCLQDAMNTPMYARGSVGADTRHCPDVVDFNWASHTIYDSNTIFFSAMVTIGGWLTSSRPWASEPL